jgi:Domain of unknown function (DUF4189)
MNALRSCLPLLVAAALLASNAGASAQDTSTPWPEQDAASPPKFGALAFTADGSFTAVWKQDSKDNAVAKVETDCKRMGRGECQVVGFRQELCAAIASFRTAKDLTATYAGGGVTRADARRSALERCNGDDRAGRRCQVRTVVCGDGR